MGLRGPKARPAAERFAEKLAPGPNGCIEWQAGTNGVGYGVFHPNTTTDNRKAYAHRWAWEQANGPIPEGFHLDHLCRNTICVNPEHLEPVPPAVNLLRGISSPADNARKVLCKRGHPLSGENLYVTPSTGYRHCRACTRANEKALRELRRKPPQATCKRGHPLSGDNLYTAPGSNRRHCRTCRRGYYKKKEG